MHHGSQLMAVCALAHLMAVTPAAAQSKPATTEAAPSVSVVKEDDDAALKLAEPDFTEILLIIDRSSST